MWPRDYKKRSLFCNFQHFPSCPSFPYRLLRTVSSRYISPGTKAWCFIPSKPSIAHCTTKVSPHAAIPFLTMPSFPIPQLSPPEINLTTPTRITWARPHSHHPTARLRSLLSPLQQPGFPKMTNLPFQSLYRPRSLLGQVTILVLPTLSSSRPTTSTFTCIRLDFFNTRTTHSAVSSRIQMSLYLSQKRLRLPILPFTLSTVSIPRAMSRSPPFSSEHLACLPCTALSRIWCSFPTAPSIISSLASVPSIRWKRTRWPQSSAWRHWQ